MSDCVAATAASVYGGAQVLVYENKLMLPERCVCLKKTCQSHSANYNLQRDGVGNKNLLNMAGRHASLFSLLIDDDLTASLNGKTKQCVPLERKMRTTLAEEIDSASPLHWATIMERLRKLPHIRRHVSNIGELAGAAATAPIFDDNQQNGSEASSSIQAYMGGVVFADSSQICYDPVFGEDCLCVSIEVPLVSCADVSYDLDLFLSCKSHYDSVECAQKCMSVSLFIGRDKVFERGTFERRKDGFFCRLLSGGVPSVALQFMKLRVECRLPISAAFDAPLFERPTLRYRYTVIALSPRERECIALQPIMLDGSDKEDQSPWLIKNGTIAKLLKENGKPRPSCTWWTKMKKPTQCSSVSMQEEDGEDECEDFFV